MKTNRINIAKWAILSILVAWAAISFIVIIGEESPNNPIGIGAFMLYKFFAVCSLILCGITASRLHKKGWLPKWVDEFRNEDI
ncbi:MAG: hypothetical protein ACLUGY_08480 [Phocaeicola massiliensis]